MTELYVPNGCTTLDKLEDSQIRIGIQGPPFSGKTTAALTFPNPVILSFDRKVSAHKHRSDAILVPFHDSAFVDKIVRRDGLEAPPNRKDALLVWLSKEGVKLSPQQTLILDGSTGIEEAFHTQYAQAPVLSRGGEINEFAEWRLKIDFFGDLHTALKACPCHVVYIAHETPDRDKKGELNGKFRPLLTGQAGDKLAGNFTDWFRALTFDKPTTKERTDKFKEHFHLTDVEAREWINSTPDNHSTIYVWQTCSDETFSGGTSSLIGAPKYVLANYQTFLKYRTHQTKQ